MGGIATIALASPSAADPDIDSESAAAVIEQLQEQGYAVEVNGAPAGDTSLLEHVHRDVDSQSGRSHPGSDDDHDHLRRRRVPHHPRLTDAGWRSIHFRPAFAARTNAPYSPK